MPSRALPLLLALLAAAPSASRVVAESIPILDPGFDVFKPGTLEIVDDIQFVSGGGGSLLGVALYTGFGSPTGNFADVPAGWTATGMSPSIPPAPSTARIREDASFRHPTGTVASINSNGSGHFMQTLAGVTLQPNTVYTLSIDVLDRDTSELWGPIFGIDVVGLPPADMIDVGLYAGSLDVHLGGVKSFIAPANGETSTLTRVITTGVDVSATPGELIIAFTAAGATQQIGAITTQTYFDNVRLDAMPVNPAIAADFDDNGGVDATDLDAWRGAFGASPLGDADGDLDSDGQDLLAWQTQLGSGATSLAAVIPEPAAVTLAALAAAALRGVHVRRRKFRRGSIE